MELTMEDKRAIDEAVEALHYVSKSPSGYQYIEICADYREDNEFLLQPAYDKRQIAFQEGEDPKNALADHLRGLIDNGYIETIAQMEGEILKKAGFDYSDEKADALLDYLRETYPIVPDYDHFLNDDMCVNIMLRCGDEGNRDFVSIHEQYESMFKEDISPEELTASLQEENGLSWLVKQQGYTMEQLYNTVHEYNRFWDSPEAEGLSYDAKYNKFASTHSPFLTSLCQELANMVNYMNTMTVLTKMSMTDFAEFMQPGKEFVLPKNSMIGIFNPWNGGGSTLDIVLEKDLVVPSSLVYDVQIEGAKPDYQYTVDSVYGLVGNAWVSAKEVRDEKPEPAPSLDALIQNAASRAGTGAGKNEQSKSMNHSEQGRG